MKTLLGVAILGITACQTVAVDTTRQSIDEPAYCAATLPPASKWKPGEKLPALTPDAIMISAELDANKDRWGVYGVDPVGGKIVWLIHLTSQDLGRFQTQAVASAQPYGGVRGPIGGCIRNCGDDPPAAFLLNYAELDRQLEASAAQATAACGI